MNHNCRIKTKKIAGHTAYFFKYDATPDTGFEFSMLCEVGQPFIPMFEAMIKKRNLKLKTIEIDERPWVITIQDDE